MHAFPSIHSPAPPSLPLQAGMPSGLVFDVVVANILRGPLVDLQPRLEGYAAPGSTLLLSGILTEQVCVCLGGVVLVDLTGGLCRTGQYAVAERYSDGAGVHSGSPLSSLLSHSRPPTSSRPTGVHSPTSSSCRMAPGLACRPGGNRSSSSWMTG